jgi:hypothetical protein
MTLALVVSSFTASIGHAKTVGGASRWATFQNESQHLYALSLQADSKAEYPRPGRYEVVLLFDTSASQTGWVRQEGLEVLEELAITLPVGTLAGLVACDVQAVQLTQSLVAPSDPSWASSVDLLKKRVPLGATDLSGALRTAAKLFSESPNSQRTIIYIGDGVNRCNFLSNQQHRQLIDDLVQQHITFSTFVIGPVTDIGTVASIANHTGGILYSRQAIEESTQVIGRNLGLSAAMPVVWVQEAQLPASLSSQFPQRFPPLRLDRDSVILGHLSSTPSAGQLKIVGQVAGKTIQMHWDVQPEASHPDLGFLTSLVERHRLDGGLTLAALGSDGLRALSLVMADNAADMIKSGRFALVSGQPESALRIAEEALKQDPGNPEANSLKNAAEQALEAKKESIPTGKLMQFNGSPAVTTQAPSLLAETLSAGDLLAQEQEMRRASAQALQQHVRNELSDARKLATTEPTSVKNSLKLLLEEVDSTIDIDASTRTQLRSQIGSAIQQVSLQEAKQIQRNAQAEAVRAQADAAQRLLNETRREEESLKQLVEHFNFLMSRQRYLEASKDVAPEIAKLVPDSELAVVTREESSLMSNQAIVMDAFKRREQGVVDALRGVEEAAIPFDGFPSPVVYPSPEIWQALSARRKERYAAVSLSTSDEKSQKLYSALKQTASQLSFQGTPLSQVVQNLADEFKIPIWVNVAELEVEGVDPDSPITMELPPISLRSALRMMLKPLNLTYIIRNEVLEITTEASVEADPINRIYPVGDLVVPRMPMGGGMGGMGGGMGGMGGGMGGMGMGGMGGGMGGMGMGGGMGGMGMGGGMGGMGMGGGAFSTPDDSTKQPVSNNSKPAKDSLNVEMWVAKYESADEKQREQLDTSVQQAIQSQMEFAEAQVEAKQFDQAKQQFQKVIDLVSGLLSAGYPQPWMYQALSLSMEACDYPAFEIKRVLMSSLDFEADSNQLFEIARYLAGKGFKSEALQLLRDLAVVEPLRYDVFAFALPLAKETQDPDALQWVCLGILGKAWPKEHAHLYDEAKLLSEATRIQMAHDGRVMEATAFEEKIKNASLRDIIVKLNWTGHADLDLRVREPAGTICSASSPLTIGGGTLVGDVSSAGQKAQLGGYSEYYVCPQGFAGQYDILIRKIWGEVSGGKATVEIYTDFGTPEQNYISQAVDLSEKDVMIQVAVKNGQRKEPIADAQVAAVKTKQLAASRAVLSQIGSQDSRSGGNASDYFAFRQMQLRNALQNQFGFPIGRGAVGYQPVITTLPEGASLSVSGVVSADRRYVRINPSPFFTGIGEIFTFNFVTGNTGAGGTGGVGQGGIGGGAIGGGGVQ